MSVGFRLFLLILLGFAAVWIYRFRAPELHLLLNPARPVLAGHTAAPLPADRAWGRLEPPVRTGWEGLNSADWNLESWAPERLEAGATPWSETGMQEEASGYEIGPDSELVPGAFEESEDGSIEVAHEDGLPAGDPTEGAGGAGGVDEPRVEPASGTVEVEYVVQTGDNLWIVAAKFLGGGQRYEEIKKINALSSDTVLPGTRLRLHVPEKRVPEENLKSTDGADDKSVEESSGLREGSLTLKTHKVKARETLSEIASRYFPGDRGGVEVLLEANRTTVLSPDEIREGQILVIPSGR